MVILIGRSLACPLRRDPRNVLSMLLELLLVLTGLGPQSPVGILLGWLLSSLELLRRPCLDLVDLVYVEAPAHRLHLLVLQLLGVLVNLSDALALVLALVDMLVEVGTLLVLPWMESSIDYHPARVQWLRSCELKVLHLSSACVIAQRDDTCPWSTLLHLSVVAGNAARFKFLLVLLILVAVGLFEFFNFHYSIVMSMVSMMALLIVSLSSSVIDSVADVNVPLLVSVGQWNTLLVAFLVSFSELDGVAICHLVIPDVQ